MQNSRPSSQLCICFDWFQPWIKPKRELSSVVLKKRAKLQKRLVVPCGFVFLLIRLIQLAHGFGLYLDNYSKYEKQTNTLFPLLVKFVCEALLSLSFRKISKSHPSITATNRHSLTNTSLRHIDFIPDEPKLIEHNRTTTLVFALFQLYSRWNYPLLFIIIDLM